MALPDSVQKDPVRFRLPRSVASGFWRAALFTLLWVILSNGAADSWVVGVPTIAAATWLSLRLLPAGRWSLPGLLRFVPAFFWLSLSGGFDVAQRALRPGLHIRPTLVEYPIGLSSRGGRLVFAFTVSLLPGTLSANLDGECLLIHALDKGMADRDELRRLELRIARVIRDDTALEAA